MSFEDLEIPTTDREDDPDRSGDYMREGDPDRTGDVDRENG